MPAWPAAPESSAPAWPPTQGPGYPATGPAQYGAPWAPAWPAAVLAGPAPGVVWAGLGHRFAALLIDFAIFFVSMFPVVWISSAFGITQVGGESVYSPGATATYLIWLVLLIGYFPTCWWAFQGTIGQRVLGLRVVRAWDGGMLGIWSTTLRYVVWAVCTVTWVLAIAAAAMSTDKPNKQTWWDQAGGSVVIRKL